MTDLVSCVRSDTVEEPALMARLAMNAIFQETFKRAKTVIAPLNTEGERTPIFWVHSVVGSGTDPIRLSTLLGPEQPFYSIRVPNALRNHVFGRSVERMAEHYVAELIRVQPQGPIVLGAWSAGVVVALDMAQKLKAAGREVSQLVAVDFAPFNTGARYGMAGKLRYGAKLVAQTVRLGTSSYGLLTKQILRWVANRLRSLTCEHPSDTWIGRLKLTEAETAFVRALHDGVEAYVPKRYDGAVLLYTALQSDRGKADVRRLKTENIIMNWKAIAPNLTTVGMVGDHTSIMIGENVGSLARDMLQR